MAQLNPAVKHVRTVQAGCGGQFTVSRLKNKNDNSTGTKKSLYYSMCNYVLVLVLVGCTRTMDSQKMAHSRIDVVDVGHAMRHA
jgi:hypothetical protein